ncbi:D-alanine--D-alanine ligase [Buchnera aphidicola (Brachycaudus cardui)]|uniref:D-alanine--D-alanine ligase n=1 Tax=Buchnera aphidicola (Brachycaudus cardui) TaxID=557993 RepID=A0A4D6XS22_9GAMM|nr:D-alanine--D-alanine ligase [Buchnera aphidicola]QCI20362.1 D-alanine--D-alanine ligase [Buchnera aphidicola (Brachycaudus cardui)]
MNKKIAVLLGGNSSERAISIKSGQAVLKSLLKSGFQAYPIDLCTYSIMQLTKEMCDKAYIALHGKGGEDGSIQGVLEYLKIPYTGSGIMASSISIDKFRTKLLWKSIGLLTAPNVYITKKNKKSSYSFEIKKILKLGFPVVVKPNSQGSSIGITIVSSVEEIDHAMHLAFEYDKNILIEKFIQGREYTVSILNNQILPPIHILTKNYFYDYNAKYKSSSTQYFCPSGLNKIQEIELKKIVLSAWNIIGCSGCGRIDVILDKENNFWLLEVNTIPGMTERSLLPMSAKEFGISFDALVLSILRISI